MTKPKGQITAFDLYSAVGDLHRRGTWRWPKISYTVDRELFAQAAEKFTVADFPPGLDGGMTG